ncbi:MAG: hypothetical protein HFE73_11120 [Firmicutes bacterium]|nr:hypothetical protein [Bacillota bacterium]
MKGKARKKGARTRGKKKGSQSQWLIWLDENLSTRAKVFLIVGVILLIFIVGLKIHNYFYSYDGLGEETPTLPQHSYDYESALQRDEKGLLSYEDERYTSRHGIDVSSYQKKIDWERVKADGVDFAMIRLGYRGYTQGMLKMDAYYEQNITAAPKAGVDVGVYFFSQAVSVEEAIDEAKYVLKEIRGKDVTLPVAFDMEPIPEAERINNLTVEERTAIADAFCQIIEKNGYEAMVYGNPTWLTGSLNLHYLGQWPIWLAHYTDVTSYPYSHVMWQYTDNGRVDGIEGKVDLNLWMVEKK